MRRGAKRTIPGPGDDLGNTVQVWRADAIKSARGAVSLERCRQGCGHRYQIDARRNSTRREPGTVCRGPMRCGCCVARDPGLPRRRTHRCPIGPALDKDGTMPPARDLPKPDKIPFRDKTFHFWDDLLKNLLILF